MARVYVHMRIGEHFGMAPVEAMSQAVIPIIPRESGLAEIISNGFVGYVYNTDNEALEKIVEILKSNDAKKSIMLGKNVTIKHNTLILEGLLMKY